MMCHYRLIYGNKCPTLVQDVDSGRGCPCGSRRHMGVPCTFPAQFFCKAETALKIKFTIKKKRKGKQTTKDNTNY